MSDRYNHGSHYENHQKAAEVHNLPEHTHGAAAERHDKQVHLTGHEQSRQAFEHSTKAYEQSVEAHQRPRSTHEAETGEIAALAYHYWQARGCPEGSPEEDWLRAVRELESRK
jgi:hypothetical protein